MSVHHTFFLTSLLLSFYWALDVSAQAFAAEKVLLLGDSGAQQFGQFLERLCIGTEVTNAALGGTTALDWASYEADKLTLCEETSWDTVFISVGGNDYNGSGCSMSKDELSSRVEDAVENIMFNIVPGASKYFMLSGCMLPFPLSKPGCYEPKDYAELLQAFDKSSPTVPEGAEFAKFQTTDACGGSETSYSDEIYFKDDGVHLNSKGYCAMFTRTDIKIFLSCTNFDKNCECLDYDLTDQEMGTDQTCANHLVYPILDPPDNDPTGNDKSTSSLKSHIAVNICFMFAMIVYLYL